MRRVFVYAWDADNRRLLARHLFSYCPALLAGLCLSADGSRIVPS